MKENSEVEAIQTINNALINLKPDEQQRVLNWAIAKFAPSAVLSAPQTTFTPPISNGQSENSKSQGTKVKGTKKSKSVLKMVKDLNLHPKDELSAMDFSESKKPSNAKQKSVLAVYYLRDIAKIENVAVDHVYTFFKSVGWPVPADLPNMLAQAGTSGWLDTSDGQAILLTTTGENLIEHQLPAKAPK